MKKIVIKTDCPEADNVLIACIRMLFPECEIKMLPVKMKSFNLCGYDTQFSDLKKCLADKDL